MQSMRGPPPRKEASKQGGNEIRISLNLSLSLSLSQSLKQKKDFFLFIKLFGYFDFLKHSYMRNIVYVNHTFLILI